MQYSEYLESLGWGELRKAAYGRAANKCELCKGRAAAVHHVHYPKNGYENDHLDNLVVVCKKCHKLLHGIREGVEDEKEDGFYCDYCEQTFALKNHCPECEPNEEDHAEELDYLREKVRALEAKRKELDSEISIVWNNLYRTFRGK